MTTQTTPDTTLEITRHFNASPERVYEAWTDPAQMKQWFQPGGAQTEDFTSEVRVGGKYRWNMKHEDGEEMSAYGEYRELIPARKIVFTWQWDDDEDWTNNVSVITIDLTARDGGTDLVFRHENLPSEASRDRHIGGWTSLLDSLERFIKV